MALPGMMWEILVEVFGPGKPAFGMTLVLLFSFIYGVAKLMMKGKYRYRRQARLCYTVSCLAGGFGYTFYWMYATFSTPITTFVTQILGWK